MTPFRDCKNRLACMGDTTTGLVETVYHGITVSTYLAIGKDMTIQRQDTVTRITRPSEDELDSESYTLSI